VLGVEAHGGHCLGSTRDQESTLLADELVFLLHAFGLAGLGVPLPTAQCTVSARPSQMRGDPRRR